MVRVPTEDYESPGEQTFGLEDLVEARALALRKARAKDDEARAQAREAKAMARAFGIDFSRRGREVGHCDRKLRQVEVQIAVCRSPFEGMLETTRTIAEVYQAKKDSLPQALTAYRRELVDAGALLICKGWGVDRHGRVTRSQLAAAGLSG